jgi:nuclease-like protein
MSRCAVDDNNAETPWSDLAVNAPGQGVAAEARAARTRYPVRMLLARVLGVHTDERAWRVGAKGEQLVGRQLATLGTRWKVVHSIPIGQNGTDIDHLVIGPAGVYCINAKHHPGKRVWVAKDVFMVNGHRQPYIHASRHEAAKVGKLLTNHTGHFVQCVGVIVVVRADDLNVKEAPRDVHVIGRRQVVRWLRRRPEVLSDIEVQAIFESARQSTTWTED